MKLQRHSGRQRDRRPHHQPSQRLLDIVQGACLPHSGGEWCCRPTRADCARVKLAPAGMPATHGEGDINDVKREKAISLAALPASVQRRIACIWPQDGGVRSSQSYRGWKYNSPPVACWADQ